MKGTITKAAAVITIALLVSMGSVSLSSAGVGSHGTAQSNQIAGVGSHGISTQLSGVPGQTTPAVLLARGSNPSHSTASSALMVILRFLGLTA